MYVIVISSIKTVIITGKPPKIGENILPSLTKITRYCDNSYAVMKDSQITVHRIKMKEKLLKTKSIMGMGILAIGMIFGISILNNNLLSQQTSFLKLNNGVGICFQRITQTFTALMIRDLRSDYLTSDFRSTTGDNQRSSF